MAVTKTSKIETIVVNYPDSGDPIVSFNTITSWDDPNDDELPISKSDYRTIEKMTSTITYDTDTGEATTTTSVTDYSGEDAKVIAVCDAVWPSEAE